MPRKERELGSWVRLNSKLKMRSLELIAGGGIHGVGVMISFRGARCHCTITDCSRTTESFSQFAKIDSGFWAWDFYLKDENDRECRLVLADSRSYGYDQSQFCWIWKRALH